MTAQRSTSSSGRAPACGCGSCARPASTCGRSPRRIGERLGTGAHLAALIRTRSGDFTLDEAVGLDVLDRRPAEAAARVIPLAGCCRDPAVCHADRRGRVAGRAGRVHRPGPCQGGPGSAGASPGQVCSTRMATWWPLPSARESRAGLVARFASGRGTGIKYLVWD